jgi:holo-[acyl-carrier protein] synthase
MSQILGIGVDIIEVDRIAMSIKRFGDRFLKKIFTPAERDYCSGRPLPAQHFAARFAAKEAVLKALGTGWTEQTSFREVEVVRAEGSAPTVVLSPRIRKLLPPGPTRFWLSISHTHEHAVAQALITHEGDTDHHVI